MTVKRRSIVNTAKSSPQPKTPPEAPAPVPATAKPMGIASMRRIVSKKLAVGKLVMAKRLT